MYTLYACGPRVGVHRAQPPSVRKDSGSVETGLTGPAVTALESEI